MDEDCIESPAEGQEDEPHPGTSTENVPSYFTQKPLLRYSESNSQIEEEPENAEPGPAPDPSREAAQAKAPTPRSVPAPGPKGLRKWLPRMKMPQIARGGKDPTTYSKSSVMGSARARAVDSLSSDGSTGSLVGFNREGRDALAFAFQASIRPDTL